MMKHPILVIPHTFGVKTELDYLFVPLMLDSVVRHCPDTQIIFPNTNKFKFNIKGVDEWMCNHNNIQDIIKLRETYIHLSSNSKEFELACLERFYILQKCIQFFNIKKFYTIETDCLVLHDLNTIESDINKGENSILLNENKCISTGFLTEEFINNYCQNTLLVYNNQAEIDQLRQWNIEYLTRSKTGGVNDMLFTAWVKYGKHGYKKQIINDLSTIHTIDDKHYMWDNFFTKTTTLCGSTFKRKESIFNSKSTKFYDFDSSGLFCYREDSSRVYMKSIHLQGNSKLLMSEIYTKYLQSKVF